jgi:hypothetical protein
MFRLQLARAPSWKEYLKVRYLRQELVKETTQRSLARAVTHFKRRKRGGVLSSTTSAHQSDSVDKDMMMIKKQYIDVT